MTSAATWIIVFMSFLLAFLLSLWGTPVAGKAALRFGIIDKPDGRLKRHESAVPYFGGLAVFTSFIVTLSVVFRFDSQLLGILLGSTLVALLGIIDDLGALSPGVKLAGQLIAVWCLINSDVRIKIAAFPPWLQISLTVLWVMTLTNGVNLIDIMDGLAAGVSFVAAAVLTVNALISGRAGMAVTAACLAGAVLGFLRYNLPKARIFMGDAGSMFLGFILAALAMSQDYADRNPLAVLAPLLILSVPLFDLMFVILVRLAKGISIFRGSPDHVALRLRKVGWSTPRVLLAAYGVAAAAGVLATLNRFLDRSWSIRLYGGVLIFFAIVSVLLARIPMPGPSAAPDTAPLSPGSGSPGGPGGP